MKKVIITADVEDAATWEEGFRTHVEYFKSLTVSKPIQFTASEKNQVAICIEPDNLDKYLEGMDSQETADAMAHDGVKRETVKIYVLDKELQL